MLTPFASRKFSRRNRGTQHAWNEKSECCVPRRVLKIVYSFDGHWLVLGIEKRCNAISFVELKKKKREYNF